MLAGVSLPAARRVCGHKAGRRSYRTSTDEIRSALKNFGFRLGREVPCEEWSQVKKKVALGLLSVNYRLKENGVDEWHWLVYDSENESAPVFDPRTDMPREWNSRTRLFSYFHVRGEA